MKAPSAQIGHSDVPVAHFVTHDQTPPDLTSKLTIYIQYGIADSPIRMCNVNADYQITARQARRVFHVYSPNTRCPGLCVFGNTLPIHTRKTHGLIY